MPSTVLFIAATFLLSLNFVRLFGLAISDWLYFAALGLGLLESFLIQRQHAPCWWRNRLLWAVAFILFGAIISTMNSQNWVTALVEIFQQVYVMTLFVSLIWIMVRRGKTTPIILAFILSGMLTAIVVLVDYLTGSRLGPMISGTPNVQLWGRFAGTLGHPNKLGYFLVLTTLLSIGQLLDLRPARFAFLYRLFWSGLITVQAFGIYLSGSMTAYLGLLIGALVFIFPSNDNLRKITKAVAIGTSAAILVILVWFIADPVSIAGSQSLTENSIYRAFYRVQTNTAGSRLAIYTQAWEQIIRNPWFGVGYDQVSTSGVGAGSRFLDFAVHNPLLQIWYTGGIFAFIGWLAIYVLLGLLALDILIRSKRQRALTPLILSLFATALALLLMDQFQDAIYQREKWLVIGLLAGTAWEKIANKAIKPVHFNGQETHV